ncbi:hypothetical protein XcodCFBP4690_13240 [Xanthomonas codiaei]|nr:hypothetical protein XcodCFBP4690_13240 [Xanthomonas codiaei]
MTQAMLDGLAKKMPLDMQGTPEKIEVASAHHLLQKVVDHLGEVLHKTGSFENPRFDQASLHEMFEAIKLPSSLTIEIGQATTKVIRGRELVELYQQAAMELKKKLENGKTPFLAMINEGRVVPVVFGFEKIFELQSHRIEYKPPKGSKSYSYQDGNHPLSGSPKGGKLKEVEVRDLRDLSTLSLGCIARGVIISEDVTIRLKQRAAQSPPAHYLTSGQRAQFEAALVDALALKTGNAPCEMRSAIENASIEQLQEFNSYLRSLPLTRSSAV